MKFFLLSVSCALALVAPSRCSPFIWFGTNEAGAEFGQGSYPGELGTHYIWPDLGTIATLKNEGMNAFRVAFSMERLVPSSLVGPVAQEYMDDLIKTVNGITDLGAYAVIDPHNFGRYYGNIITSVDDFAAFWTIIASEFASNDLVIFDTNNEYHTMDQTLVLNLNQAAINAIRAANAKTQYIFVEGNSWSGAWTWPDVNDNMKALADPIGEGNSKIIYEMHQYLDVDGSGTNPTCVSSTIGRERVTAATNWLRQNGKRGILGEFAGANNQVCKDAVGGLLAYLEGNSDVWLGGLWWAAGPWWGDYMFNLEPENGVAYQEYMAILRPYFVRKNQGTIGRWSQCGGNGWTGPTVCESPWSCQEVNEWYWQCV